MTVKKTHDGSKLTVSIEGKIDSNTASMLSSELDGALDGIKKLTFDLSKTEYISSAGLRVLLTTQKIMNEQGKMIVINVNESILEVFDVTGFSDILTVK